MVNCLIKNCSSRTSKKNGVKKRFYFVPSVITNQCEKTKALSRERRLAWLKVINRPEIFDKDSRVLNRVCSDHFLTGKPSALFDRNNPDWIPTLRHVTNPASLIERHQRCKDRARRRLLTINTAVEAPCKAGVTGTSTADLLSSCIVTDEEKLMDCSNSSQEHLISSCEASVTNSEQESFWSASENLDLTTESDVLNEQPPLTFEIGCQAAPSVKESSCQANPCITEFSCQTEETTLPLTEIQKNDSSCQTELQTSEDLEHRCKEAKIEIVTRQSFLTDVTDAVKNLVRQDARIIVGMFYGGAARRVLCEAYRQKVYGKQFVWFLIGWYEDDWYLMKDSNHNCTVEQMKEAVEGHFTTEALMLNQDSKQTISGMTSQEFIRRYTKELSKMGYGERKRPEGFQEAPLAYDAIWAITLALNKTITQLRNDGISLEDFTYTNSRIANEIYSAMNSTQFLGVSGHVAFSSKGDRMAWTQIEQMIDGEYKQLGFYDTQTDNLTWIRPEYWPDGRPPQDRTIIVEELRTVSLGLFFSMCSVAFIGIIWAIGLLVFNWLFRHSRYIQLSHPMCNNILLLGIIFCLLCVCFLGLDGQFVEEASFSHMCQARAWLLTIGFTLSYGAMFSKIWRVHRLTTKTNNDNKKVESWKLYVLVGALLFFDIIILTTWQIVDPLQRKLEVFPQEDPEAGTERDIKIQPLLEHCESEYNAIWLGVLYSYKGLLLIFGIFLAYETRSVKIKQLNDSRLVGMSIYNVVVLCLITAPVTLVISSQQDATFAFVALAIIFCSFLSMALVFIPKVIELVRRPKERADARSLTDTISSKEEEERHQRLLLENEDFKRQIAQKEEEIQVLTLKLREKQNLRSAHVLTTTQLGERGERVRICFEPQIMDGLLLAPGHKKDSISIDPTSDSGFVTGTSFARSSRASHSDFEFSESYL